MPKYLRHLVSDCSNIIEEGVCETNSLMKILGSIDVNFPSYYGDCFCSTPIGCCTCIGVTFKVYVCSAHLCGVEFCLAN